MLMALVSRMGQWSWQGGGKGGGGTNNVHSSGNQPMAPEMSFACSALVHRMGQWSWQGARSNTGEGRLKKPDSITKRQFYTVHLRCHQ